jgi:hypothetical protein
VTRSAGSAVHSTTRALSRLIRATPRRPASTGCAYLDRTNAGLRMRDPQRAALPVMVRRRHRFVCVISSQSAAHRCDARLRGPDKIEQQLPVCIFRFRTFRTTSRSRYTRAALDRAACAQLPSRCILSRGRVAPLQVAPSGGCELRRSCRFSWVKMPRSIDENVAYLCRDCSRADSPCAVSSSHPMALIPRISNGGYAFATSLGLLFRPSCTSGPVA